MKEQTANIKRSIRRAKPNFTGSRPNRRADLRHRRALASYDAGVGADKANGGRSYVKPGSQKRW